jgi:Uma2 family endonuclease
MLELMTTSFLHDSGSVRLSLFVTTVLGVFRTPHRGARRTTYRREDAQRGFEPDESFYIQNVAAVRGVREIDLTRHPPPDLVIEIDHTRSSLPKHPVFAAFGVPEVWRFDGTQVTFFALESGGGYQPQANSRALPLVTSAEVTRLLPVEPDDDTAYTEAVRAWAAALVPPPQP